MGTYWTGTSGYSYDDWKDIFYPKGLPQKKWLSFYAQHFNTVEINATFYRYFPRSVFARWRDETPDKFRFTLKGPRDITHIKYMADIDDELNRFVDGLQNVCPKIAMLLWQFPPGFKYDADALERLATFMEKLPPGMRQVFEFRHRTWFNDMLYDLLNRHHAGFVINDSAQFVAAEKVTGDFVYLRFHGPQELYASLYDTAALAKWADKIRAWLNRSDVYAYFNNDFGGRALQNARELRDMVNQTELSQN